MHMKLSVTNTTLIATEIDENCHYDQIDINLTVMSSFSLQQNCNLHDSFLQFTYKTKLI